MLKHIWKGKMTSLPVCLPLRCHGNTSINSHHWLGHTHSNSLSQLVDVPIFQYFPHICLLPENTYTMKLSILKLSSVQILILTGQFYLPTTTYLEMGSSVYLREWREGGILWKKRRVFKKLVFFLSLLYVMKEDGWLAILQWLLLL